MNARDNNQCTPLHWTAYKGYLQVVKVLRDNGADLNAKDVGGRTPLRMAVIGQQCEVEQLLRDHGALL